MNYYNNLWVFKCLEILLIIVGLPGDGNTSLRSHQSAYSHYYNFCTDINIGFSHLRNASPLSQIGKLSQSYSLHKFSHQ